LPVAAAVELLADPCAVAIARAGCSGYWLITVAVDEYSAAAMRTSINAALGVTPAQAAAIGAGSMFGWNCPAADPINYDAAGKMLRQPTGAGIEEMIDTAEYSDQDISDAIKDDAAAAKETAEG
jgi:hypothetical protein